MITSQRRLRKFVVLFGAQLVGDLTVGLLRHLSGLESSKVCVIEVLERRAPVVENLEERDAAAVVVLLQRLHVTLLLDVTMEHKLAQLGSLELFDGGKLRPVDVHPLEAVRVNDESICGAVEDVERVQPAQSVHELADHLLAVPAPEHLLLKFNLGVERDREEDEIGELR